MQSMNGVNINLFQFERDLTWMAFFMDDQDRIYARYGGREDQHAESHLNKESLLRVMQQVLALHAKGEVQTSRYESSGKPARTPEDIPTMKALMASRKEKCIHCHDVKVAELRRLQALDKFTRELVFTYPAPSAIGLRLDPKEQNKVADVLQRSPAAKAGVRAGDVLLSADGQRVLTLGDLTRVLELTPKESRLPLQVQRGREQLKSVLELSGNWKRSQDPSWRESLHVAGPGAGIWGMKLSAQERKALKLPGDAMAVRVTFIFGDFARQAGVQVGDVIVELDSLRRDFTIHQLHGHLQLNRNYGDSVPITVHREGQERRLVLKLPKQPPKLE
jgi:predicted metalloprotease with PDZ domain